VDEALEHIRKIRATEDMRLKPSPYLRDRYVDEWGVEQPVTVRNYQAQGIMNLLQVENMVLGDDTGLGKTLQVLSAIGYVWMKEPEYVPIVVTRKSSLYQWGAEVEKFMTGMEAVTVDHQPFERDEVYKDFFLGHDRDRKRLLITTYDILFKDMEESVVRDRTPPDDKAGKDRLRKDKKRLKEARARARDLKAQFEEEKGRFKARFDGRPYEVHAYVRDCLKPPEEGAPAGQPQDWDAGDEKALRDTVRVRDALRSATAEVERLNDVVAPPIVIPGVLNYVQEMLAQNPGTKVMFVMDEVHWLKNYQGKMHKSLARLAALADRRVGMTATPVKNRLMEFFALFRIVQPDLFPKVSYFHNEYCITKLQPIGGGRKVIVVVGHSKKQLKKFVDAVEPYYLSRKKHDVAKELPELVTREVLCELSPEQEELYDLAELDLLDSGADPDAERADVLKGMTMVQQACNAPQLLMDEAGEPFEGESSKRRAIVEMLKEDFIGVKTVVFSRFEKMISLVEQDLVREEINYVRITGKESKAKDREDAKNAFQDLDSGVDVILITLAGGESINLHAAQHIVYVDSPWSWGDYVQINGRAIRIGSRNDSVLATHLIARRRSGAKTIDDYVIKKLRQKKVLADTVAGESLKGGLEFVNAGDDAMDIFAMIRESKKDGPAKAPGKKIRPADKVVKPGREGRGAAKSGPRAAKAAPEPRSAVPSAKVVDIDLSDI